MSDMIKLTINGTEVEVEKRNYYFASCKES